MEHGNQHWIPRGYLGAWRDPDPAKRNPPRVYRYGKDGLYIDWRTPSRMFSDQPELYTRPQPDGSRDLSTEHQLQRLEDAYVRVRDRVLAKRKPLTDDARADLVLFIAALRARSPFMRDHHAANDAAVLRVAENVKASLERMTPEQRSWVPRAVSRGSEPSIKLEDFRSLAARPFGERLLRDIEIEAHVLARLHLSIFLAPATGEALITSDAPVVWWDPLDPPPSRRSLGLGRPTVEVTLPLTPRLCASLTYVPRPDYIELGPSDVDQLNRRVLYRCQEIFLSERSDLVIMWDETSAP